MKRLSRRSVRVLGIGLGCVIGGAAWLTPSAGEAREIVFVAQEVEDQQAVWLPTDIVIHRGADFTEPLIFRFANPTERTHVFEAPGLFESVQERGVPITRPVRMAIPPEGMEQSVIDQGQMVSDMNTVPGEIVTYRFYCPLHRGDAEMGGRIIVEP